MSCKHEFWTLRNQPSICMGCGKTRREIELEAQNKLMREALRKIINVTSNCLSHEEMKDKMKNIAKAALEGKSRDLQTQRS